MKKADWKTFCKDKFILLDGATGSNLMKAGMPSGVCPEQWILEHPEALINLQRAYVEAGSHIVYAPTFTANRVKLKEYGLYEKQEEMIRGLVTLSKEAAGDQALVAGDITMTGQQLAPIGTMELEELIDIYKEQIIHMEKAGVDLLIIETMMSLAETRAAVIAAKEVSELPVLVTMTFEASGKTLFGTDAKTAAIVLESLGVDALGVNCSTGPAKMAQIVSDMASVTSLPLIAKPNAGLPVAMPDGSTAYDMEPAVFAEEMKELVQAGAVILGGCCGTSPEYILALRKMLQENDAEMEAFFRKAESRSTEGIRYLTSERQTLAFGLEDPFMIVGERINPTGKKLLQAKLREGDLDLVLQYAQEQQDCGAQVLDINVGMSGIDEKSMMLRVLEEVQTVSNLPLSLDSSHVEVLEAALRNYPGRALVNSVSLETEKIEKLLPLVKKYGSMFILLPLSDKGLPENLQEKQAIIEEIYGRALALGMRKEDIVVDGLVTTVGANRSAGVETLETIRYCKARGLATICGLSNISFGMPSRIHVNTTFLVLAIQAGLTMAIANPNQELLVAGALAADLLLNKEGADLKYIEFASALTPAAPVKPAGTGTAAKTGEKAGTGVAGSSGEKAGSGAGDAEGEKPGSDAAQDVKKTGDPVADMPSEQDLKNREELETIKNAVLKGNRKGIAKLTVETLEKGVSPQDILNQALLPAINRVGELFDQKKYFLPQLIAGAEAMENAIHVIEPLLAADNSQQKMPVIVLATVEGDIHDIGKNLVAMMLKNHGFQVVDLGKDVPAQTIIDAAREHHAAIIGLSALMTTTMQRMRDVVRLKEEAGLDCKIMVGGAVITPDYAAEIHADAYSSDAADAVRTAKKLLNMEK